MNSREKKKHHERFIYIVIEFGFRKKKIYIYIYILKVYKIIPLGQSQWAGSVVLPTNIVDGPWVG